MDTGTVILRIFILLMPAMMCSMTAAAQDEPEYRAEIGAGVGLAGYLGDYNSSLTSGLQPMGELLARYKLNPRMALRLAAMFGKLKGDMDGTDTWYPEAGTLTEGTFDRTLIDVGLAYEYNFWPYGTGREYRGSKPLTPYITMGLGVTVAGGNGKSAAGVNFPLGVGVKYKIATRLNLGVEWVMHFCTNDELDGMKDPYGIKSGGLFKNTDCYHMLKVSFTYDIAPKCKTCNNDDW